MKATTRKNSKKKARLIINDKKFYKKSLIKNISAIMKTQRGNTNKTITPKVYEIDYFIKNKKSFIKSH